MNKAAQVLRLIRVRQWHKNSFVLLGYFVLGDYANYALLLKAIFVFSAFCLASSGVYVLNDFKDIEADRNHFHKKNRPLASGDVSVKPALFLSGILCLASLSVAYAVNVLALLIVSLYLINNITYSFGLKRYPIIDVFQLGLGFMLRIFAGTVGIGIYISEWMILTGFMISLFIGFSKRFAELVNSDGSRDQRLVLKEYSVDILKSFMLIMASATIITYSLYTLSPRSVALHGTTNLVYTTPFVVFGIFRFLYLVLYHKSGEDPSSQIFEDRQLIFTLICWALTYGLIIY
ncbi:MAG: decaprenyl-phosphate phosphoribosyltransferase [Nitrospiraceae bacterium]|nr:MAG: decaprenyl-phosphate phosphoribosyltransferase [Nitrospiraceae bacterium]